ncbi:MAG: transcription termination/antitermination protein NusA [Candidatus Yanofskybacteria bacterium]|nr:transcription termination/antitermination protein NusA [Candidatus Yanofskybacteria bacterium]
MIDIKQFVSAIKQIAEEKGIPQESVLETVEAALAAAYKRDYGKKGQIIKVKLNSDTGEMDITQTHYVVEGVDEEGYITGQLPEKVAQDRIDIVDIQRQREAGQAITGDHVVTEEGAIRVKFNPEKHIALADAKAQKKGVSVGDEIVDILEAKSDFGRIAAQTAKQVVIQRLREAERGAVMTEYKGKEGTLISGVVQRREGPLVFIDLGKVSGILPVPEQMPSDHYRIGQRLRFYIVKVEDTVRGPAIVLSRAHPNLVRELFRMEVPEIDSGAVKVLGIAREAGSRTKIAVASSEDGVDPIGSLVGQRGVRVQTVINDLAGEKIDIIQYDEDAARYIANALSPAKILQVNLTDVEHRVALAEVADDQFSLAIGKGGQNVRLAAKLTGWKIDVRSPKEVASSEVAPVESVEAPVVAEPEVEA